MRKQQKEIWFGQQNKNRMYKSTKNEKLLPIVKNYDAVGKILENNYKKILNNSNFCRNFKIVTAYKNHKNLHKYLVHSEY